MTDDITTVELTEERFDNLEKGDLVRHKDDPEGQTREVTKDPEVNPLEGGVINVRVQQATISRSNIDNWELVE
jgi:hypothetical protein